MIALYDWSFRAREDGDVLAWGLVTGHPKLPNGLYIHTSPVLEMRLENGALLLTTRSDHLYALRLEAVCPARREETATCLASFGLDPGLAKYAAQARQETDTQRLERFERELAPGELLLEVVGTTALQARFRTAQGELKHIKPYVHVGMIQDSVLIMDTAEKAVDFRYFPMDNWLQPYHVSDGLAAIKLNNLGGTDVLFGVEGRETLCKAGELTILPAAKHDVEWLFSPDCVNGKGLYSQLMSPPNGEKADN